MSRCDDAVFLPESTCDDCSGLVSRMARLEESLSGIATSVNGLTTLLDGTHDIPISATDSDGTTTTVNVIGR